eukprot:jgi/Botrbrau1/390/Bobra.110_2s0045.1
MEGKAGLEMENEMLEQFLKKSLGGGGDPASCNSVAHQDTSDTLSAAEKLDILLAEVEASQNELQKAKEKGESALLEKSADVEVASAQIAEIKRNMYEFKREMLVHCGENSQTNLTVDQLLKFLDGRMQKKEDLLEKLKIKCGALKVQTAKVDIQLQVKQNLGDALMPVDFDQLKIENRQVVDRLQACNAELLSLKTRLGNIALELARHKTHLDAMEKIATTINKDTAAMRDQAKILEVARATVAQDLKSAQQMIKRIENAEQDSEQPQILDMINITAEVHELEYKVADWQRKCEIAEMDAGIARRSHHAAIAATQ